MPSRRSVLVGLGGLVAGGGALIGTGAFTTVTAERTVNVETAGDANAFLSLDAIDDSEFVDTSGDTVTINLDSSNEGGSGLNQRARTTFRNLIRVTNNGSQELTELRLSMDVTNLDTSNISSNETNGSIAGEPSSSQVENLFSFTVSDGGDNSVDTVINDSDILSSSVGSGSLQVGNSIDFGIEVDLLDNGIEDLPAGDTSYTLIITANTSETQ